MYVSHASNKPDWINTAMLGLSDLESSHSLHLLVSSSPLFFSALPLIFVTLSSVHPLYHCHWLLLATSFSCSLLPLFSTFFSLLFCFCSYFFAIYTTAMLSLAWCVTCMHASPHTHVHSDCSLFDIIIPLYAIFNLVLQLIFKQHMTYLVMFLTYLSGSSIC